MEHSIHILLWVGLLLLAFTVGFGFYLWVRYGKSELAINLLFGSAVLAISIAVGFLMANPHP